MYASSASASRAPTADDGAEAVNAKHRASSRGRFRVQQLLSISPAAFERGVDKLNTYFDGTFFLQPMWSLDKDSGGGLECLKRHNRNVPGKGALRLRLGFDSWSPTEPALLPTPIPIGPLRSKQKARSPEHALVFESDAGIRPWTDEHMILLTAGLCAIFDWKVSGGLRQRRVLSEIARISTAMQANSRGGGKIMVLSRQAFVRKGKPLNPLASLVTTDPGSQPTAPK